LKSRICILYCLLWCLASASQAFELKGTFAQGGLLFGRIATGEKVVVDGQMLQQDEDGNFIIGLDRDAGSLLVLEHHGSQGVTDRTFQIAAREYRIQHIEGVEKKYVAPDPRQVERSRKEARQVWAARQQQRAQNEFLQGFIWPAIGPITGVFGSQRVYNGEPRRPHYGVDVAGPVGTRVVAPASGLITLAEEDLFFSGGTIIIDHGHGLSSSFLHLSSIDVAVGENVQQGQVVGAIGATGRVTGAHLDWRMNWTGGGKNVRIDPQLLVPEMDSLIEGEP